MTKVLVIEDDPTQLKRLSFGLEQAGFEVKSSECIISGLEESRSSVPDVILCSDKLPGLGALDLLDLSKEESSLADVPVIVFSETHHEKLDCFKAGCDDFIIMPADEGELELRIKAVTRRGKSNGVSGSFAHISIFDLIQLFMGARQTGVMSVDCGSVTGEIGVDEGQVVNASSKKGVEGVEGEDAFVELLKASQAGGNFVFEKIDLTKEKNIEKRTDHLLLGIANMLDES